MGVLERLRWVREEEKGRWTKLRKVASLIPKWWERSRMVMLLMISTRIGCGSNPGMANLVAQLRIMLIRTP